MCFYRWNLHETVIINEKTTVTLQVYIWGSWMQASTQLVIFFVWTKSKLLKFTDRRTLVKANNKTMRFDRICKFRQHQSDSKSGLILSWYIRNTVYRVIFSPYLFYFVFTTFANNFTRLKFAQMHLLEEILFATLEFSQF